MFRTCVRRGAFRSAVLRMRPTPFLNCAATVGVPEGAETRTGSHTAATRGRPRGWTKEAAALQTSGINFGALVPARSVANWMAFPTSPDGAATGLPSSEATPRILSPNPAAMAAAQALAQQAEPPSEQTLNAEAYIAAMTGADERPPAPLSPPTVDPRVIAALRSDVAAAELQPGYSDGSAAGGGPQFGDRSGPPQGAGGRSVGVGTIQNLIRRGMRVSVRGGSATSVSAAAAEEHLLQLAAQQWIVVRRHRSSTGLQWVDVTSHPTTSLEDYRNGISFFLQDLGAHSTLIENTMEAVLLPQTMVLGDCTAMVFRCAVPDTTPDMDSIQELTNRVTLLIFNDLVVSVHRTEMQFLSEIRHNWDSKYSNITRQHLVNLVAKRCSKTFQEALAKSIVLFDRYEAKLFAPQKERAVLAREIYHIKRRASVYSRILAMMSEAYAHGCGSVLGVPRYDVFAQDVTQHITHVRSLSDELNDNASAVLQLLFQLSSYQLNELMRVLTMFSAFFIPLSFIASFYGMNFEHLPLMQDDNGPVVCGTFMIMVGALLLIWFKAKGFW